VDCDCKLNTHKIYHTMSHISTELSNNNMFVHNDDAFCYGVGSNSSILISNVNGIAVMKFAQNIQVGDEVMTPFGPTKVKFIIKTITKDLFAICCVGGHSIFSPYCPVMMDGEWVLPINSKYFIETDISRHEYETGFAKDYLPRMEYICNFGLEEHHSFYSDGFITCGLAHCIKDNEVLSHPFFGTKAVEDAVRKITGGTMDACVRRKQFVSDPTTGLVDDIIDAESMHGRVDEYVGYIDPDDER
jgi:hypothetical protein